MPKLPSIAPRALAILLPLLLAAVCQAEYVTPGTGVQWTLDDLVAASGGAVTGTAGSYEVHESVVVATADRLTIAAGSSLTFLDTTGSVGLEIRGQLIGEGTATAPIVFAPATETPGAWRGLDFRETGADPVFRLVHADIGWADIAVDVYGADVELSHCRLHHTASKALDISSGDGVIADCRFTDNQQRTITLTLSSSPEIHGCHLEDNNLENDSPYTYISIGLQGTNSPQIIGNTILGSGNEMSGGISIWNASNALIEDNEIRGCGYGILCYQTGANPTITGNLIADNTINPDTVNWGFGVASNGSNTPILTGNTITGHWYGVAAINGGQPNLGDLVNDFPGDDGGNLIEDNGLGGEIYGFYNNTALPQMAQGNWWGTADAQGVEDAIFHQPDDPSLGPVTYDPWLTTVSAPAGAPAVLRQIRAHPNPFNPRVTVAFELGDDRRVQVTVLDLAGRVVRTLVSGERRAGTHAVAWDGTDRGGRPVPSGVYFARVVAGAEAQTTKLSLVR